LMWIPRERFVLSTIDPAGETALRRQCDELSAKAVLEGVERSHSRQPIVIFPESCSGGFLPETADIVAPGGEAVTGG
jgi:hypothetical protein